MNETSKDRSWYGMRAQPTRFPRPRNRAEQCTLPFCLCAVQRPYCTGNATQLLTNGIRKKREKMTKKNLLCGSLQQIFKCRGRLFYIVKRLEREHSTNGVCKIGCETRREGGGREVEM